MAQPDLDYMAPEIQLETTKYPVPACDIFSFGLLISSIYNAGRSLIQAAYNPSNYSKELDKVLHRASLIAVCVCGPFRIINYEPRSRSCAKVFSFDYDAAFIRTADVQLCGEIATNCFR
jgi:serine/threonine protein kinase